MSKDEQWLLAEKYMGIVNPYIIEWGIINPSDEELRANITTRLKKALERGLLDEVRRVRAELTKPAGTSPEIQGASRGDARLNELGLEYRIVGEFLRGERTEESLLPALSGKLWQLARRQKAWLRKLYGEGVIQEASSIPDRS